MKIQKADRPIPLSHIDSLIKIGFHAHRSVNANILKHVSSS
jgi:hypothetical protein